MFSSNPQLRGLHDTCGAVLARDLLHSMHTRLSLMVLFGMVYTAIQSFYVIVLLLFEEFKILRVFGCLGGLKLGFSWIEYAYSISLSPRVSKC